MNKYHTPVLLKEVTDLLQVKKENRYIDATLGGGGHTSRIIDLGGLVLGLDQDQDALSYVSKEQELNIKSRKLILAKGNFREIDKIALLNNFEKVNGILFDLGVSSFQIDTPERGFSFLRNGPLDMRMDRDSSLTAEVIVNLLGKKELTELLSKLGQEHRAYSISKNIVNARKIKAIKTTEELTEIIKKTYGIEGEIPDYRKNEISKRVFQALRIAVNSELENLSESLPKALSLLGEKGRLAVITFHSLEDSVVKKSFEDFRNKNMGKIITDKPIVPKEEEQEVNPRSRSAKLRVFEKN